MSKSVTYLCTDCGSSNVSANTRVIWNYHTQRWVIDNVDHSEGTCDGCGAATLKEVVVNDDPPSRKLPNPYVDAPVPQPERFQRNEDGRLLFSGNGNPMPKDDIEAEEQMESEWFVRYVITFPDNMLSANLIGPFVNVTEAREHARELGMTYVITNLVKPEDSWY